MKLKFKHPISVNDVIDHPDEVTDFFIKTPTRKDTFVEICLLEGGFLADNVGEIYSSVSVGEDLKIVVDKTSKNLTMPPLLVATSTDDVLGQLPFSASIMPNVLMSRGLRVWCCLEAKQFNGGMPDYAVSVYCEKY